MPTAELIFEDKEVLEDGSIIEMRIWRVPSPVPPSAHSLKYSLFYGRPGELAVLFDNERGKGDHRHIGEVESAYRFERGFIYMNPSRPGVKYIIPLRKPRAAD
jgi:hypothetical protein